MYGAGRSKGFKVKTNLHQFIVLFDQATLKNIFKTA